MSRLALGLLGLLVFVTTIFSVGCGGQEARGPNQMRPLDERRAIQVIINAFRDERAKPIPGRDVQIQEGVAIELDVGASGRKFGVAYTTPNERAELGNALPGKVKGVKAGRR